MLRENRREKVRGEPVTTGCQRSQLDLKTVKTEEAGEPVTVKAE